MPKIAVSCSGTGLDDKVDPRFGRAANFVVVDTDTMEYEVIDNSMSRSMAGGAGIQAAETVTKAGATCVLSGYIGPKAFQALAAAGVKMGQGVDGLTVREAVERFKAGSVEMAAAPSKQGHWA